jgi:hypothetical protein
MSVTFRKWQYFGIHRDIPVACNTQSTATFDYILQEISQLTKERQTKYIFLLVCIHFFYLAFLKQIFYNALRPLKFILPLHIYILFNVFLE